MNTNGKIFVSRSFDNMKVKKRLVFIKWLCLVAVNVIAPWMMARAIGYTRLSDNIAILCGLLCIVIALVKIDYRWTIWGKTVRKQALITGAIIKAIGQFVLISDLLIGVICIGITEPLIDSIRPIGIMLATLLVGTANLVLCFVGGFIVVSFYRSIPIVARRRQIREDIIRLKNQLDKEKEEAQLATEPTVAYKHRIEQNVTLLLAELEKDDDWQRQKQIITVLQRALHIWPPVLSWVLKQQVQKVFLKILDNAEAHQRVRIEAAAALSTIKNIKHIKSFLPLLSESDKHLRKNAAAALQCACPLVYMVVFGDKTSAERPAWDPGHTLLNPDVSRLTVPMRKLKTIAIQAQSSDLILVEVFARYMSSHIGEKYLKRQVTVYIQDKQRQVPLGFWSPFSVCKYVDVYIANIEVVVFGTPTNPRYTCQNSLCNPDVVTLTLPMSHLKQVNIYPETSDLRRLEEFCTYAVNFIGQHYLKKYVDVHIYGDLKRLHANLRNTFNNLCRGIYVHDNNKATRKPDNSLD